MAMYLDDPSLPDEIEGFPVEYRSDRVTLEHQAYYDPLYRTIWTEINNNGYGWLLEWVFMPAILSGSWVVLQFYGMSNSGKSWLAIAKALELKFLLEKAGYNEVEIVFSTSWTKTLDLLQSQKKGDIIICDEESNMSGEESETESMAMSNVLRSCRVLGINLFFVDPTPVQKPNVDAWIRVVGKIPDIFTTMSLVYAPEGKLVGLDFTKIPTDNEQWTQLLPEYDSKKLENVHQLLANRGRVGVDLTQEQIDDANFLIDYAKNKEKEGVKVTQLRLQTWADDAGIIGSVKYVAKVVTRAYEWFSQNAEFHTNFKAGNLQFSVGRGHYEEIPSDFIPYLYDNYWPACEEFNKNESTSVGTKLTQPMVRSFLKYCESPETTYQDVDIEVNRETVSREAKGALSRVIGIVAEYYLLSKNPKLEHYGGYTNEPDLIDHENKQVISVKFRSNKDPYVKEDSIAMSEFQKAKELGYELWMWVFSVKGRGKQYGLVKWRVEMDE